MVSLNDIQHVFHGRISLGEPVARYSSLCVGGPADYVLHADSRAEVEALQRFFAKNAFPHVVLRSNTVISDKGFRGAVILDQSANGIQQRSAQLFKSNPPGSVEALIERAGIGGLIVGGAEMAENSIINNGGATSDDIRALALHASQIIEERCNVRPEIDLQFIGFDSDTFARVA